MEFLLTLLLLLPFAGAAVGAFVPSAGKAARNWALFVSLATALVAAILAYHFFNAPDVATSGYVEEEDFAAYFAAVDRLVNLRYPSAGETSGTLIRAFEAGKPVAVSDYAQFAELPDDCVVKIPFGDREVDELADFLVRDLPDPSEAQRKWLEENANIEKTVEGYLEALASVAGPAPGPGGRSGRRYTFPLFPLLEASLRSGKLVIRNAGDFTLRARTYGQPGYRLIVNGKWLELPRDLAPGEETDIPAPAAKKLRLVHGIQGVPVVDEKPFAVLP